MGQIDERGIVREGYYVGTAKWRRGNNGIENKVNDVIRRRIGLGHDVSIMIRMAGESDDMRRSGEKQNSPPASRSMGVMTATVEKFLRRRTAN